MGFKMRWRCLKNHNPCYLKLNCFFSFFCHVAPARLFFVHTLKPQKYANSSFSGLVTSTSDKLSGSRGKRRARRIWFIGIGLVAFQHLCGAIALAFHMELVMNQYNSSNGGSEIVKCIAIAVSALQVIMRCCLPTSRGGGRTRGDQTRREGSEIWLSWQTISK